MPGQRLSVHHCNLHMAVPSVSEWRRKIGRCNPETTGARDSQTTHGALTTLEAEDDRIAAPAIAITRDNAPRT